jgi:mono/diheme cytochrome c family protein
VVAATFLTPRSFISYFKYDILEISLMFSRRRFDRATLFLCLAIPMVAIYILAGCGSAPGAAPMDGPPVPVDDGIAPDVADREPPMDVDDERDMVSFRSQILPLLQDRCAVCHSEGGLADFAGIPLRLEGASAVGQLVGRSSVQGEFTLVVAGDPEGSYAFQKLVDANPAEGERMPLAAAPLSEEEIQLIRDWIAQGALDN